MTIVEAVDKLRELKGQFCEVEVSGEFRGEHLFAEWHTARYPNRAKEEKQRKSKGKAKGHP